MKTIIILVATWLYANDLPIKIIAIYNTELAFRVDIDGLDVKICLNNTKPIQDKLNVIKWYINKRLKENTEVTTNLPTQRNQCLYGDIYFDGILLQKLLKDKKLITTLQK